MSLHTNIRQPRQADMQLAQISLSLPIAVQVNILPLITTSELLVLKINV